MKVTNQAWLVGATGTFAIAVAVVQAIGFQIGLKNGWPFEPAVATGIIVVAMVGVATCVIARTLAKIEARLTAMEVARPAATESQHVA